ncbi:MAG: ribonuclease D [Rhodospirillaceae bacterium]|nr:ribonuclease D [Rhodospirillaceae bacterium]
MSLISDNAHLAEFCARLAQEEFVAVDTEFIREKTYYPQLCLLQIAGESEAYAIDTLAPDIDLGPVYELMRNPHVIKVFHAARQDIEIFVLKMGDVPAPLFDTQIAAMVCGYGEQAGYETLVQSLARASIDKSARFTDWARRPLTPKQIAYALSDVTHLRTVYRKLKERLDRTGRLPWVESEMQALANPAGYRADPREVWRRLRVRSPKPRFLAVLRELAAWRELAAQQRDIPRQRMLRDEALLEIAAHQPKTPEELAHTRGLSEGMARGKVGTELLAAIETGLAVPESEAPRMSERPEMPRSNGPVAELLRVLLKMRAEEHNVAPRLIADSEDLDRLAAEDAPDVPAMTGWRRDIFGEDALALKQGRLALVVKGRKLHAVPAPTA